MTHQDSPTLSEETLVVISFILWKLKNKSAKVFEKHAQNRDYHEKLLFSLTFHNPPTHPRHPQASTRPQPVMVHSRPAGQSAVLLV